MIYDLKGRIIIVISSVTVSEITDLINTYQRCNQKWPILTEPAAPREIYVRRSQSNTRYQ